jgi:dihydrolipoamide dehydrogenase
MVAGEIPVAVDVVVLGGGPGGYVAALRAASLGRSVALIEQGPIGGTCLNRGCIPSKALLHATGSLAGVNQLASMGIDVGRPLVDFSRMQSWKQSIVERLATGVQQLLAARKVEVTQGKAYFRNQREVWGTASDGAGHRYEFAQCIIATGAEPRPLAGLPFDGERVLTPEQTLGLNTIPSSLAVVGSDAAAIELATIYARLGSQVQLVVPAGTPLLSDFDPLAGRLVTAALRKLGVNIEANSADPASALESAPLIVVSAGYRGRTADLRLNEVGLSADEQGFLAVDQRQATRIPSIFAVGDVTGGPPLATIAIKQGRIAAEAGAGMPVAFEPQAVPRVIWSEPEVAAVGMHASQAEAAGFAVVTGRFPLAANGRALTINASDGAALVVAERDSGVLLGVTLIGARASELIGEAALALEMGATLTDLSEILHPHPALAETLGETADVALGQPIHIK